MKRDSDEVVAYLRENSVYKGVVIADGIKGAIIGILNNMCGGEDNRRILMGYVFGKTSTKSLTEGEWYALYHWVNPRKGEDGKWGPEGDDFRGELVDVLSDAFMRFARLTNYKKDDKTAEISKDVPEMTATALSLGGRMSGIAEGDVQLGFIGAENADDYDGVVPGAPVEMTLKERRMKRMKELGKEI